MLTGDDTEAVQKFGHDCLPTFGVGKEFGKQEWRSIFRQLHGAGIIALDITGYGSWTVTEAGRRVLKGAEKITLRKDTLKAATRKTARAVACGAKTKLAGGVGVQQIAVENAAIDHYRTARGDAFVIEG